jgi:hypothetical protein
LESFFAGKIHAINFLQDRIDLIEDHLRGRLVFVQAMLNCFPGAGCQMAQILRISICIDPIMAVPRSQELLDNGPQATLLPCGRAIF